MRPALLLALALSLVQGPPDSVWHDVVSLSNEAERFEAEGYRRNAADHYREAAFVAQQLQQPSLVAALLARAGNVLLEGNDPQLAVVAFEQGLRSLNEGERFNLDDTLAALRDMEKDFSSPRLSVPDDVYTAAGAASLEEQAADRLLPARLLVGAGNAYLAQPQDEPARTNYLLALEVTGVEDAPVLKAQILTNLSIAERRLGMLSDAETRLVESLRLFGEGGDPTEVRRAIHALGTVQLERGDLERAEASFRNALRLHREKGDEVGQARALAALGRIGLLTDRLEEAEVSFREAKAFADAAGDRDAQLHAYVGLGVVLYETSRLDEAAELLHGALSLVDVHQRQLRTDEGKVAYLETVTDLFDLLLEIEIERVEENPNSEVAWLAALNVSEQVRGRATRDLMGSRRRARRPSHHPPPAEAIDRRGPSTWGERHYDESESEPDPVDGEAPSEQSREPIDATETEIPGAGQLRESPGAPGLDPQGNPSWTPEIRGVETGRRRRRDYGQQDQDAAFTPSETWRGSTRDAPPLGRLSFHLLEDRALVFAVDRANRVVGHVVPKGGRELAASVTDLREALGVGEKLRGLERGLGLPRTDRRSRGPDRDEAERLLRLLYRDLITPVADHLPAGEPIAVLPHGALWLLPFAALVDEDGGRFIDRWPMVFASSPDVLDDVRSEGGSIGLEDRRLLAVGDPSIPSDERALGLEQLDGAEEEARLIYGMVSEDERRTLLLGTDAQASQVAEIIGEYDIVHFASHGLSFDENPLDSYLVLAASDDSDGRLTARQVIRDLEVPADLVTLSACQTGLGLISGDGMLGLGRSFLVGGARSVLVSLWSVNDEATTALMTNFYRAYFDGVPKAAALQQAMQSVRDDFKTPDLWAPFVLLGADD